MTAADYLTENARQLDQAQLRTCGRTLIVAPHQDDESLGCGGTIHLLTESEISVHVVFVSDGSMSHPNSGKYPSEKLTALREAEAVEALQVLGVWEQSITFLKLKDSLVPASGSPDFDSAVRAMGNVLSHFQPDTIFCPWQRDPHQDHRATWQIVDQAIAGHGHALRRFEYFVWLWERADPGDLPVADEGVIWKINIEAARERKKKAIAAHVSQTTSLIDDDPGGFTLSAEVLAHFDNDLEIFFERK